MNEERFNDEQMIEEYKELVELEEAGYEEEENEYQESDCNEPSNNSVLVTILAILKKIGAIFVVVGTTIVLYKCRGCMVKWAVRMLEKRGFTVIQPTKNAAEIEEEFEDDDQIDQDQDVEETEE